MPPLCEAAKHGTSAITIGACELLPLQITAALESAVQTGLANIALASTILLAIFPVSQRVAMVRIA